MTMYAYQNWWEALHYKKQKVVNKVFINNPTYNLFNEIRLRAEQVQQKHQIDEVFFTCTPKKTCSQA